MPSVREIAKHAGVAISTVSLVLNNKPGVSDAMRERVRQSINLLKEREGLYEQNRTSGDKNSIHNKNLSVVVLHPAILRSSQVFGELLQGIEAGAARYNLQLRLMVNDTDPYTSNISQLYFSNPQLFPDGVLVIGDRTDVPLPQPIYDLEIPRVLVGRVSVDKKHSAVGRNEEEITYRATEHLIDLGHRAIAFVGGELAFTYTQSRLQGYKRALLEKTGAAQDRWIALGDGAQAAEAVLDHSPEITAAIFINDAYAMEALPVFAKAGRSVPKDLSVISFDDTHFAQAYDPPLTSIAYPRYEEGLHAVRVLVDMIRNPGIQYCQVLYHAELIKRKSCTPPKNILDENIPIIKTAESTEGGDNSSKIS